MSITIYLAGACQFVEDEGAAWREDVVKKLKMIGEWCGTTVNIINPLDYFTYKTPARNPHQIKRFYMSKILECNLVLCNCYKTNHSPGTAQECQFAADHNIPIIGFDRTDAYSWLVDVDCQVVFANITEALDYIRDYYIK